MAINLQTLVSLVQNLVPARDGVPDNAGYEQAVQAAVMDCNRRCPGLAFGTLALVAGVAGYALPADCLKIVRLSPADGYYAGLLVTADGLAPVSSASILPRWTVQDGRLVFQTAPVMNCRVDLVYQSGHVLVEGGYPHMDGETVQLVALKAQAEALMMQANRLAAEAWQYQIGQERVSKEKLAAEVRAQAQAQEERYVQAVARRIGAVGGWGHAYQQ